MPDVDQDLIDEDKQLKAEERHQSARRSEIYRDPFYPPEWAADEYEGELVDAEA